MTKQGTMAWRKSCNQYETRSNDHDCAHVCVLTRAYLDKEIQQSLSVYYPCRVPIHEYVCLVDDDDGTALARSLSGSFSVIRITTLHK